MAYQLTIQQEPHFLHVVVTGTNNAETVARYLDELRRECIARRCYRLLIEERLEGERLSTFPVYKVISEASERAGARPAARTRFRRRECPGALDGVRRDCGREPRHPGRGVQDGGRSARLAVARHRPGSGAARKVARIVGRAGENPPHQGLERRERLARVVRVEGTLVPGGAEVHAGLIPGMFAQPLAGL